MGSNECGNTEYTEYTEYSFMNDTSNLVHGELTGHIRQAAFEVHNYFGMGFLEKVYENALVNRLEKLGLATRQQASFSVKDEDGTIVGAYMADLVVSDTVIVEIKAAKALAVEHEAQLINYLRATQLPVGLLLNFGRTRLQVKRIAM